MTDRDARRAPIRRVLVGIDGFEPSLDAVQHAARLPLAPDAWVTLLHVIHRELGNSLLLDAMAEQDSPVILRTAEECASEAAASTNSQLHFEPCFVHGLPAHEISRVAERIGAELVVLGQQHERHTIGDALFGSTAEQVARHVGAAVLVVRSAEGAGYQRPLVMLEPSARCKQVVRVAMRIMHPTASQVDVLISRRVGEDSHEGRAMLDELREVRHDIRWNVISTAGERRGVLLDQVEELKSDLVVVCGPSRSFLAEALGDRLTATTLRKAHCDVLFGPQLPIHHPESQRLS